MSSDIKQLEELGAKVADALGEGPDDDRILIQRRDFLSYAVKPQKLHLYKAIALTAAVAAAVLMIVFQLTKETLIPFGIGGEIYEEAQIGKEGQWVRADSISPLPVHFQGGSRIDLSTNAAARIVSSSNEIVRIDLAAGKVHCNINGNKKTQWQVEAGPYTIKVTGTVFDTAWNPETSKLDVSVSRGSVMVTGANLSEHGVKLSVGDRLHVDGKKSLIALNPELPADEVGILSEKIAKDVSSEPKENEVISNTEGKDLISTENIKESVAGTAKLKKQIIDKNNDFFFEGDNFDRILAEGDVEELWKIATQARYKRNGGTAQTVLMTIRNRFASSSRAETAAFLLGRVMLELQGNPSAAAEWFKRYLNDTPKGPLAEESLGRLFDAYNKAGRTELAVKYATEYMTKYPTGLFADSAAQILKN